MYTYGDVKMGRWVVKRERKKVKTMPLGQLIKKGIS